MHSDFVKPQYGSHCFADIPSAIQYWLTGEGQPRLKGEVLDRFDQQYETVIFFLIDAFGWRFMERYGDHYPFLRRLIQQGHVTKLTSQFPSTTAAHVTTLHTGLPVGQSGMYEWYYYEPEVGEVIAPLLYSYAGTRQRDTLKADAISPTAVFPYSSVYQALSQYGVASTILQHGEYTPSTYSDVVFEGARVVPYLTLPEALTNLQTLLAGQTTPSYYVLYFDKIDTMSHRYGPSSPQLEAEIDTFLTAMDRLFEQKLRGHQPRTLFVMSADHGQIETEPATAIYLNQDDTFAGIETYLKSSPNGQLLVPAGSPRDLFLYTKDDLLEEAQAFLATRLDGRADVVTAQWLIEAGYFGPEPISDLFRGRLGNLVILPHHHETVWWYEKGKYEQKNHGQHGGLTPEEMEIPLCLYDFAS